VADGFDKNVVRVFSRVAYVPAFEATSACGLIILPKQTELLSIALWSAKARVESLLRFLTSQVGGAIGDNTLTEPRYVLAVSPLGLGALYPLSCYVPVFFAIVVNRWVNANWTERRRTRIAFPPFVSSSSRLAATIFKKRN
jgi:hypothetical protein